MTARNDPHAFTVLAIATVSEQGMGIGFMASPTSLTAASVA